MNKHVIRNFKKAIKKSPVSHLEIAWNLKTDLIGLDLLLRGKVKPTEQQEADMIKFSYKHGALLPDAHLIELFYSFTKMELRLSRLKRPTKEQRQIKRERNKLSRSINEQLTARGFVL